MKLLAALLCLPALAAAGILVTHTAKGLEFTQATSILIAGKDKALNLGPQPKLAGPLNKLPNLKFDGTLLNSADTHVVALYEEGSLTYLLPEGLPKTAPNDPVEIWKTARLSY